MITYSGEDIEINITLLEKLERDFGLTLPQINEDFSVETILINPAKFSTKYQVGESSERCL